jgi:AcrR family transcriptional regulator
MRADGHTAKDIAKYLGVGRATLYRYLSDDRAA